MKALVGVALIVPVLAFSTTRTGQPAGPPQQRGGQAQQHDMGVGRGHIPAHGPTRAVQSRAPEPARPAAASARVADQAGHPVAPHVHAETDEWVGHDDARNMAALHLDHPWAHGHFPGTIGAQHVWRLEGGSSARFNMGGFYFGVATPDFGYTSDWIWGSDDIVLYPDPDIDGYYLAYNVRLGTYVHVTYLGN